MADQTVSVRYMVDNVDPVAAREVCLVGSGDKGPQRGSRGLLLLRRSGQGRRRRLLR